VAVTVLTPSLVLEEVMYFMPSAPLIAARGRVVTADSTVWALAPVIDGRDADLRRREIGKLRDGKRGDADGACENDQQGADGREYGAMNKKVDHSKTVLSSRLSVLSSRS